MFFFFCNVIPIPIPDSGHVTVYCLHLPDATTHFHITQKHLLVVNRRDGAKVKKSLHSQQQNTILYDQYSRLGRKKTDSVANAELVPRENDNYLGSRFENEIQIRRDARTVTMDSGHRSTGSMRSYTLHCHRRRWL